MIVFPDSNVETEYTDPNGSVWEFNGTGWVRKPQAPSDGGNGDDGWGGPTQGSPSIPKSGFINVNKRFGYNTQYQKNGAGAISFGNDVYRLWHTNGQELYYDHYTLDYTDKDNFTETEVSSSTKVDGKRSWVDGTYNVRIGNCAFKSVKGSGLNYIKQNTDKTLSFETLVISDGDTNTYGAFVNSSGNLIIATYRPNNNVYMREFTYDLDSETFTEINAFNYFALYAQGSQFAMMETPYGYFCTEALADGQTTKYRFQSVGKDFKRIAIEQNNGVVHKQNESTTIVAPARYRNGLGIGWVGRTSASKYTTTAGPIVNEDGTFPSQIIEKNGSYALHSLADVNGWIDVLVSPVSPLGITGFGGTVSRALKTSEEFNNTNGKYLSAPAAPGEVLMDAYFVNEAGNRLHSIHKNCKAPQGNVTVGVLITPSDIEGIWFGGVADETISIIEEVGNSEIGNIKQRVSARVLNAAQRIKNAVTEGAIQSGTANEQQTAQQITEE